jgi:gas vesicle protein
MMGIAKGLVLGIAIGAGIGLLYAPQAGKKTRKLLNRQVAGIKDRAEDLSDTVVKQAEDLTDALNDNVTKYRKMVLAAMPKR